MSIPKTRCALDCSMRTCSEAGTPASDVSMALRECGYVEVGCGKSASQRMLSIPIRNGGIDSLQIPWV